MSTSTIHHPQSVTPAPGSREERDLLAAELFAQIGRSSGSERQALIAEVVELHLELACKLAGKYSRRGIADDDLQQVACLALVRAARDFDPDRGVPFLSYAFPCIRGELRKHFRDAGWSVRPPRRVQELRVSLREVEHDLTSHLGRNPTVEELAEAVGAQVGDVVEVLQVASCYSPKSIDALAYHDGTATVADSLTVVDAGFRAAEARVMLEPLLEDLSQRERMIIDLRFVEGLTQQAIGDRIGISQMQISRILSDVFARLRAALGEDRDASTAA